jgi:hypothetical protein
MLVAGVVDDAFGNKLVSIPEPGTRGLLGAPLVLLILALRVARAKRLALSCAALLVLPALMSAQNTTQKTKANQIGPTGRSDAPPRPPAPNVCVQHTVSVDAKTGTAALKADFTNKDKNPKSFVSCQMIGVSDVEMQTAAECDIVKEGTTIKCKRSTRQFNSALDTFHFGCKQVTLAANEKKTVDYGSGQNDKFKGKKASDFKVTYADYVQLEAGVTFDEASCTANKCFGKNANTGLSGTPAIMGDWYLPKLPFDDPYLTYQPICKPPLLPEYRSLSLPLATPSSFPATVPQMPPNVPMSVPPSYSVPLNLFDVYTMMPDSPSVTAGLAVTVTPSLFAPDFSTSPSPDPATFVIPGGAETFGSLTIARPTSAAEGDSADVSVVIHLPDSHRPGARAVRGKRLIRRG